jgi:UPF0716 protein FxsA
MAFLVVLFIVVPIAELYVIIQIGGLIGLWPTLALLLADAILGSMLLRHQGRGAWARFNKAIAERRFPGKEVADGLLIAIGGTLLLTPGFLTDIVGAIFLIPPTRALVRRLLRGWAKRRFVVVGGPAGAAYGAARGGAGFGFPGGSEPGSNGSRSDYDFEGTAEEIEDDDPQLPRSDPEG